MAGAEPEFDAAGIGRFSEAETFEVTAERIAQYAEATNDPIRSHRDGSVAPPVFGVVPVFGSLAPASLSVAPAELFPRLVHGEQDFRFHRPIRPGDVLTARAKPTGFVGKPAGTAVVVYAETVDSSGVPVNEQWMTAFFRKADAGRSVGETAPEHGFDESLRDTEPAASIRQHVDEDQTLRYSPASGDPMPIHLDEEMARMAGLPGIIAHGLCTMAFTSWAVLTELAGSDVHRLRRLAVRFAKPVLPGQDIATSIWRADRANAATTYAYETTVGDDVVIKDGLAEISD